MIVGDAAYPKLPWLMRPYSGVLTPVQANFNYRHSQSRVYIENAFGRLKARWRILKRPLDTKLKQVPTIIGACCILHNICENANMPLPQCDDDNHETSQMPMQEDTSTSIPQEHIREVIVDYLYGIR